ncbi:conserved exported hypothetical protein [Burkholderiales bacterium]|nr:conserved exported hypothetical protein [Burkholderiales bacterium]
MRTRKRGAIYLLLAAAIGSAVLAGAQTARAADVSAQAPAPNVPCDPYKRFACLEEFLGTGFWNRLINYYALEWGQPGAPVDPAAPPSRRDYWPATPMPTPPMPFTEWPYGGTTPLGVTRPNSIDSPFMEAIADTGPGKWLTDNNFQLYGWVDVGANIGSSTTKPGGNAPAAYLYTPNTVQLDQLVVYLDRFPDTVQKDHVDWGMRLSAIYGENYRYTTAYGLASYQLLHDNKVNGYDFPMLYGEIFLPQAFEGLMIRAGRYISLPDIEAQLAPNNYMYSHSMTYTYDNYTNTGIQTTLALDKHWMVQVGVGDGTEASIQHLHAVIANPNPNLLYPGATFKQDPGSMPTYTFCVRWDSEDGNDDVNACANDINTGEWGYNNLQWYGFTAYHKWDDKWHISYEFYHESQRNVPNLNNAYVQHLNSLYGTDGGTPFSAAASGILSNAPGEALCSNPNVLTCTAGSYGTTFYLNYSPDPLNNFSIRPEFYWDPQGQRTGTATRYGNFAVGWQHWWSPQVEARPELAYYHSFNAPAFNGNANDPAGRFPANKSNEVILSGDIIWHF